MMEKDSRWMDSREQTPLRSKVHDFLHEEKMCSDRCAVGARPCIHLLRAAQEIYA